MLEDAEALKRTLGRKCRSTIARNRPKINHYSPADHLEVSSSCHRMKYVPHFSFIYSNTTNLMPAYLLYGNLFPFINAFRKGNLGRLEITSCKGPRNGNGIGNPGGQGGCQHTLLGVGTSALTFQKIYSNRASKGFRKDRKKLSPAL